MHSQYVYCFTSWVWSHQPITCHFLQVNNKGQDYGGASDVKAVPRKETGGQASPSPMETGNNSNCAPSEKGSSQTSGGPKVSVDEAAGDVHNDSGAPGGLKEMGRGGTAGTSIESQEMAAATSKMVDKTTGNSQEKEEAAGHLNTELGSGTTSTGDPKEKDSSGTACTPKEEDSGGGPKRKGDSGDTAASKQEQKGRTSGVTETPRVEVADNTDSNVSKTDCSKETTIATCPEGAVVVKLHAFIQPGAWDVDVKKYPHAVELHSEMDWYKNCAEIKLT